MITYTFRVNNNDGDWFKAEYICKNADDKTFEEIQQHVLYIHVARSVQLLTSTVN